MLAASNIRVSLSRYNPAKKTAQIKRALEKKLHTNVSDVRILRASVDARAGHPVKVVFSAAFSTEDEKWLCARYPELVRPYAPLHVSVPKAVGVGGGGAPPVVIGAGSAGLFAALWLAHAGAHPLLVEQGPWPRERLECVTSFMRTGVLHERANIQFGCGGAGTFSDGKLQTGTKDVLHAWILEQFVKFGAPRDIRYEAHPHIGSDLLPGIVERILHEIEALGGTVLANTQFLSFEKRGELVNAITVYDSVTNKEEKLACSAAFLATGHSAREVYATLSAQGFLLEKKPFSVGYRIEHLQSEVNQVLYHEAGAEEKLGAAPYKAVAHVRNGRSAYTFCMCPGGEVVAAASSPGEVVTNGASKRARAGRNANAALLVNVQPEDVADELFSGIKLQKRAEKRAYELGGGAYVAPAQLVGDYLSGKPSLGPRSVEPTYARGVKWGDFLGLYPSYVDETLKEALPLLAKKFSFFENADAVLTGPETRSSSPLRILRETQNYCAVGFENVYPVGEGAGYAGGIMSAATDGVRAARAFLG